MDRDDEVRLIDGEDRAWLAGVVKKANDGDPAALAEMRGFLEENPQIYRAIGDMTVHVEAAWIDRIAGKNRLIAETVRCETNRFRAELLGDHPGALERMLVNQVILTHLETQFHQRSAAEAVNASEGQATAMLKRLNSAQKRLGSAVKTLESVRKRVPNVARAARAVALKDLPEV